VLGEVVAGDGFEQIGWQTYSSTWTHVRDGDSTGERMTG
jgi:hypothetical protein